jgi:stage II sporulation protein D
MRVKYGNMKLKTFLNLTGFIACFLWAGAGYGQEDNPILSIRILEKLNPRILEIQSPADKGAWSEVKLTRGQITVNGKAQKTALWGLPDSIVKIKFGDLTRIYPGQISISTVDEQRESNSSTSPAEKTTELFILNRVPLLDYVACVSAFESGHDTSQPEYLKALGVIVRAYARSHRKRHPGYDLCDLSHCQVYQGLPPRFSFWKDIIKGGRDYSFPNDTDLKSLYFHRCCGGQLESADQIWGGPKSPSRTGPDELKGQTLCEADSFFHWTSDSEVKNVEAILINMAGLPGDATLESLEIVEKTTRGRNKTLSASFYMSGRGTEIIRENVQRFVSEFGKSYGWRVFPSLWFDIKKEGNLYHFSGRGFGHGVGLCQSGALRLAQLGWNYREILKFYFPNN